ncbi:uncharacterized protein ARMOST_19769 [Armillaria ostoyae]|uniref:Uncharacterized protein n=1 Tax=Armillaria ostoyae TaxID=47428 RepID=A0A284S5G6_ARMOS|nr:uncharacterized protein ARMOST_19769 [Armillaria ostoyae]
MFKANVSHGEQADPALKNIFIILPTNRNIIHSIEKCYQGNFSTPISPTTLQDNYEGDNEHCLQLCHGEDPNLIPSLSNVAHPVACPSDYHVGCTNNHCSGDSAQLSRVTASVMPTTTTTPTLPISTPYNYSSDPRVGLNSDSASSTQSISDDAMDINDDNEVENSISSLIPSASTCF